MNKRTIDLRRHFDSYSARSAGIVDSTYGVRDEADRTAISTASENLRRSIMRMYVRDAIRNGGDIWDAAARCGMQP